MDRGQVVSGKSTAKKTLNNDVIKNVDAVKNNKIIELDPKLWYFSTGSTTGVNYVIKMYIVWMAS